MNVLYLTNKPIYPIVDGGCFAMDSFLRSLLRFASVKNLTIETYKHPFDLDKYPADISSKTNPIACYVNTKTHPLSLLKTIFTKHSYNAQRFYNESLISILKQEIQLNCYDYLIVESAYLLVYIEALKTIFKGKIILRAPNVEYKIWEDYTRFSSNFFKKSIYNYLSSKLKKFELKAIAKVDHVFAITENDKLQFQTDGIDVPITVIPFGVSHHTVEIPNIQPNKIFFLGAYNWKPNHDAALFLVQTILPELSKKHPDIELHLAGTYMPEIFNSFASKHVVIHGKVTSSSDFLLQHGILVAPIFSGSGVRIKIVEALSLGIPTVASTIAMQGIDEDTVLIANTKNEFIDQISYLFENPTSLKKIQQKAMDTIQQKFSMESIALILKQSLHDA
jgi:glycosyltransferase involved in cell wall biosynthesis